MRALRTSAVAIACILAFGIGAASAADDDRAWMPHQYGHMGWMGPGPGGMMGHGWMMGPGHGWMMGPGYGWIGPGYGRMMGCGQGWRPGPGKGAFGGHWMDPAKLSDEQLDQIGERIAERHRAMQAIAAEQDPAARRELVREHLKNRMSRRGPGFWGDDDDDDSDDVARRGYRHGGMMGRGYGSPMGPGMMGQGYGGVMGPGMMYGGQLTEEQIDQMSEQMAEGYKRMQKLAETSDREERRKLMREHFQWMQQFRAGMY